MTVEEKLTFAKQWYNDSTTTEKEKQILEELFSELNESENEKIRKEIVEFLTYGIWKESDISKVRQSQRYAKWLAYLEKQKEPIPIPNKFSGLKSLMLQYLQSAVNRKDDAEIENDTDLWGRKILDYVWKYDENQKERGLAQFNGESLAEIIKGEFEGFRSLLKKKGIDYEPQSTYWENFVRLFDSSAREYLKEQKPVECIEFDNEFKNQVSHLLASVLNKEHDYTEGFVKYVSQSLLEYAKNELKPDEWNKREKLLMKTLQTYNARIGQLVEENYRLKEQKSADDGTRAKIISRATSEKQVVLVSESNGNAEIGWDTRSLEDTKKLLEQGIVFINKQLGEKSTEWNKEDQLKRDSLIDLVEEIKRQPLRRLEDWNGYINWLKFLSKRFNLQPKVEWNEEYREEDLRTRFAFYTYKNEEDDGILYLSNVFVEETSRNKGFGTKILTAAEKVAETIGAITIRLKVKQNSPANSWYRKHGYGYLTFEDGYDWLEKKLGIS